MEMMLKEEEERVGDGRMECIQSINKC